MQGRNDPMNRTVILHYHLFKNAGTSVDQILRRNFGDRWVTREFSTAGADNSAEVADWIRANPHAVAFSTHTALGPPPLIEGVNLITVMLLRDPVARIRSVYRFERKQDADTWGTELAKAQVVCLWGSAGFGCNAELRAPKIRSRISPTALRVKVIANTCSGRSTRANNVKKRCVSSSVLPLPAGASHINERVGLSASWRC